MITFFLNHLLVLRYFRTECGKQVAYDSRVDTDIQCLVHSFGRELRASAGKTEKSRRIDETEQGDCPENFFFAQRPFVFQWCSGNRA